MKTALFLGGALLLAAPVTYAAAECEDGRAGTHACHQVDLLGHLSPAQLGGAGERLNDIWGWTDANGEEYAIVGMSDGTAFVRLPDTGPPQVLGRLKGSDGRSPLAKTARQESGHEKSCMHDDGCSDAEASAWRDMKVYGNRVFVVSEAPGFGMQVFDLTRLQSTSTPMQWDENDEAAYYPGVGHSHNIFINEDSARAYIVGAGPPGSASAGGLHVVNISNPAEPEFLADINQDGYTHDVQCVMYAGPDTEFGIEDELCFASNEDTVTIWQVNDPENPLMLSRFTYGGAAYVHQGWLSEDHRYFFVNDELDEVNTGSRTRLRVLDVSNLRAPTVAAEYLSPSLAIDHNNYVHGRWLLQSNYAAGLRVLDILDPEHPVEAAYFDTVDGDMTDFVGVWSNYRFPGSGRVVLSDIHGGLFVVQPTLQDSGTAPDLTVTLALSAETADPGETVEVNVHLQNGQAVDAHDVRLVVHLPRGESFATVELPSTQWQCEENAGRVVECRLPQLAAGSTAEFLLAFSAANGGPKEVVAMAYAREADAAPADNLDSATLTVSSPPPAVTPPTKSGGGAFIAYWLLVVAVARRLARRQS